MNLVRSEWFNGDVELEYEYLLQHADRSKADELIESVFFTLDHLADFPESGPLREFDHPKLAGLRFLLCCVRSNGS